MIDPRKVATTSLPVAMAMASILMGLTAADSRVQFLTAGNGNAQTSLVGRLYNDGDANVIYTQPNAPWESGMQILYRQLTADKSLAPLSAVYLINQDTGFQQLLMASYDTISQSCSCYWIDAKDYATLENLVTSNKYQLWFKSAAGTASGGEPLDIKSGFFGIAVGGGPGGAMPAVTSQAIDPKKVTGLTVTPTSGSTDGGQKTQSMSASTTNGPSSLLAMSLMSMALLLGI